MKKVEIEQLDTGYVVRLIDTLPPASTRSLAKPFIAAVLDEVVSFFDIYEFDDHGKKINVTISTHRS